MTASRAIRPGGRGWVWFYPLAILIAAGLILFSLGPAPFATRGAAVSASQSGQAWVLGPASLAQAVPDVWHSTHIVRGPTGAPVGVRIAAKPGAPEALDGVKLRLSPTASQALSQKAVRAQLQFKRIAETGATGIGLRLVGAAPMPWQTIPLPEQGDSMEILLPATGEVSGLDMRAVSNRTDFASGIEITQIALTPES
jgi:hypothetical protein